MNEPIVQAVEKLVRGDISAGRYVYTLLHEQLLTACKDTHLVVTRCATVSVLRNLAASVISGPEAQAWASFMRRGYVAGGTGPIQPLPIDYELEFEDAIVEAVGRMDEIGDIIDGVLENDEIQGLLDDLEAGTCP